MEIILELNELLVFTKDKKKRQREKILREENQIIPHKWSVFGDFPWWEWFLLYGEFEVYRYFLYSQFQEFCCSQRIQFWQRFEAIHMKSTAVLYIEKWEKILHFCSILVFKVKWYTFRWGNSVKINFYTPPHNSGGVLWFHVRRPCVCPSVVHSRMITWVNINGFSPNLVCALIMWISGLGLLMGNFRQIFRELSAGDTPIITFPDDNLSK